MKKYRIIDKLNYFMMNNAINNDKILKELNSYIQNDEDIEFDPMEK